MSLTKAEMTAQLMTFDKRGEGDENVNENVLLEVNDATADGYVEISFNDRNERCFLKFSLPELIAHVHAGIRRRREPSGGRLARDRRGAGTILVVQVAAARGSSSHAEQTSLGD